MKTVILPSGEKVPALGMGTWQLGESSDTHAEELATLQLGIDLGMTLLDTAEMYGEGQAETLVGEAIRGRRDQVFIVSKVYPHNASRRRAAAACERSLKRLQTDCIDLYLLHWRGNIPLQETIEAFEDLKAAGKIRHWGVSNLDVDALQEIETLKSGQQMALDEVYYNLERRSVEWELMRWCHERKMPIIAYSPLEQGKLMDHAGLLELASRLGMTVAQLMLAWLLRNEQVIVVPKTAQRVHLKENFASLDYSLSVETLAELDEMFPPPTSAMPLQIL